MQEKPIPDWNLDADRGFHYKNWSADWDRLAWDFIGNVDEKWHLK